MSTRTLHPLAAAYLDRLRDAGRDLPRARLDELVADIEEHLSEAIEPGASDAQALTVIDRLGDPEEIVAVEQPVAAVPRRGRGRGTQEWSAIFLLLFGGFLFGLGWIAGVVLLWSSRAWTVRDKLIGTLVLPGGLAAVVIFLSIGVTTSSGACHSTQPQSYGPPLYCPPGPSTGAQLLGIALLATSILAPIGTAIYLARRAA